MRKNVRPILFIICIGLSFFNKAQAQLLSGTYTINSANPTDPGVGRNFQNFTAAALALANGVNGPVVINVVVGSGPYNDQMTIDSVPGTSAVNTVTFNCNGEELFFKTENGTNRAGVKLNSSDYIIIDNLFINVLSTTDTEFGYGVHILNNADNNIIRNCKIQNALYTSLNQTNYGVVISGDHDANIQGFSYCDNNIIIGNTIIGGWDGVKVHSVLYEEPYQLVQNNQITNNTIRDFQSHGVDLVFTSGTLVENNDISGRITIMWGLGINLGDNNERCIVRGNRIHGTFDDPVNQSGPVGFTGISIAFSPSQPGRENYIVNNLMYDWRNTGEQIGIDLWDANNVNIYHNTISLENTNAAVNTGNTYGFQTRNTNANVNFINNIITVNRSGDVNNRGVSLETMRNFVSDRNNILVGTNGASNAFGNMDNSYADLAAWQLGTGLDLLSSSLDPKYTDLANGNLIPTDSAIDNMGLYVNVNNDIAGAVRNNTHPDIGAYEFLTPPCVAPIEGGDVKFLPGGILCESADLALNLVNNTFGSSQTYTWQTSATADGTYSNISSALAHPAFEYQPASTLYYRAAITCGSITVYSDTVQVITSPRLAAGTYTIDKAQPTAGTNYQSFADAVQAMACGIRGAVVFNVVANSGPYNEQVIINKIAGASSTATVTFNGNGNELNYLSTNSNERAVIKLDNASYIIVDSLKVTALGSVNAEYGFGVQLLNDADHNIIRRCTVNIATATTNSNFAGIVISASRTSANSSGSASYCDSNTVTGNTIIGGQFGITCTSADGGLSTFRNRITNNIVKDFRQYGINVAGTINSVIEGNDISRPQRTVLTDFVGIFADRRNQGLVISKNRIHNTFDGNTNANNNCYGIYVNFGDADAATPITVSNNLLYNFNGRGTQNGLYCNNADNVRFYHNTVSLEDSTGVNITSAARGIYIQSTVLGTVVKNNNVVINRAGTGARYAMHLSSEETKVTTDYNNFYIKPNPANASIHTVWAYNQSFPTLTEWRSDTTDKNSISMYPEYKDAANADYTPDILAFDNKGTAVGITTDINNTTRSTTTPDIGALEFTKCASFPVVTVASDSLTVCSGQPVTFTVSNPEAGTTYNWFNVATDGTEVHSGNSHTVNNLTTPVEFWIEGVTTLGCRSTTRTYVEAMNLAPLAQAPVLRVDSLGTRAIRFEWDPVPGATGYQVSRDGVNFTNPSSGPTGLTHTITGLNPKDTASLVVKALGLIECQSRLSARVQGTTLENPYFIPNTFTPNGNGKNDVFRITSVAVQSLRLMIFNQWGEKVFETSTPQQGWDGTYKGKQQPIGVYVYVARIVLTDGTVDNVKGTFNLVR